jgi:hypothetical protein
VPSIVPSIEEYTASDIVPLPVAPVVGFPPPPPVAVINAPNEDVPPALPAAFEPPLPPAPIVTVIPAPGVKPDTRAKTLPPVPPESPVVAVVLEAP